MEWLFDGLGTLLIGLLIGGGGGGIAGWNLAMRRTKQVQTAGDSSTQVQIAGDNNAPRLKSTPDGQG